MVGLLIFRGKKSKISRDFQGQIRGKIGRFCGIFARKSQNSRKNQPISRGFRWRKVKIHRKIGQFRGILQKKVKIRSIFRSKCSEKSAAFTGNFGGNFDVAKKQSVKSSRFGWIFLGKFC